MKLPSSQNFLAKLLPFGALTLIPMLAHAAPGTFREFVNVVIALINNALVPLIFAFALMVFLWGVARYFIISTEEAKTKGKELMVWGLIGMAVMVSVWGLVNIVVNTFFLGSGCIVNPGAFGCIGP